MKKIQKLNYTFLIVKTYIYTHTLNLKKLFIQKKNYTCLNAFFNWLPAMLNTTRFLEEKWDGSEENGYLSQSRLFIPLGRYSRHPWQCTLRIVSNLRFFILLNICASNCNSFCLDGFNIMLRILFDP